MPEAIVDEELDMLRGAEVKSETPTDGKSSTPDLSTPDAKVEIPVESEIKVVEDTTKSPAQQVSTDNKDNAEKKKTAVSELDKLLGTDFIKDVKKDEKIKKEEPVKKVEEKKVEETPVVAKEPPKDDIDLSDFGDQQKLWLRRMPADARKYFADVIREDKISKENITVLNKKLQEAMSGKVSLPDSYLEHPNAYLLSDEYKGLEQKATLAKQVYDHYLAQKVRINAGEDWHDLEDEYDPKTGQLTGRVVIKPAQQTSPEDRIKIDEYLAHSRYQVQNFQTQLGNFQGQFKEKHNNFVGNIRSLEQKYYPQFEDQNYDGNKILKQAEDELPKVGITKQNPVFGLLSRSIALNYIYRNYIVETDKKQKTVAAVKQDAIKAGPNTSSLTGGSGNVPAKKKISIDDFNKVLAGG